MAIYEEKKKYQTPVPAGTGLDRPPPSDVAAERAVLAAMLRDPRSCVDVVLQRFADTEVFSTLENQAIYNAIKKLSTTGNNAIDLITVAAQLQSDGRLDAVGGRVGLAELAGEIAHTANLESWCDTVKNFSILRKLIEVCASSLMNCYDPASTPVEIIEKVEHEIFNVRNLQGNRGFVHIRDGAFEAVQHMLDVFNGKVPAGIPTDFPELDHLTAGLRSGEMFVLAARPSIGKTAIALNIVRNMALNHKARVAVFSLEMTAEMISQRLLCTEAKISPSSFHDKTFRESDMPRLTQAAAAYRDAGIFIDETAGLSILELRAKARFLKMTENIDVVVIDYLQLMKAPAVKDNRQQEVAEISSGLKQLAKELRVPVLVLAQLNRDVEKNASGNSRPKLSHLRESGAIEQDADVVAFLHRERDKARDASEAAKQAGLEAELIVEKNRNGATGIVKLRFFPNYMEFVCASRYDESDRPPESA